MRRHGPEAAAGPRGAVAHAARVNLAYMTGSRPCPTAASSATSCPSLKSAAPHARLAVRSSTSTVSSTSTTRSSEAGDQLLKEGAVRSPPLLDRISSRGWAATSSSPCSRDRGRKVVPTIARDPQRYRPPFLLRGQISSSGEHRQSHYPQGGLDEQTLRNPTSRCTTPRMRHNTPLLLLNLTAFSLDRLTLDSAAHVARARRVRAALHQAPIRVLHHGNGALLAGSIPTSGPFRRGSSSPCL